MKKLCVLAALLCTVFALAAQEPLLSVSGEIDFSDASVSDQMQWFTVDNDREGFLVMDAASLDFTPYIEVESPFGETFTGYGERFNASLSLYTSDIGQWRIGIGSMDRDIEASGLFLLRVMHPEANEALEIGETRRGNMANASVYDEDWGKYISWYPLELEEGTHVQVLLESRDYDAYMFVQAPDGSINTYDDQSGRDSMASIMASESGTWLIGASSFSSDASGVYFLTVEDFGEVEQLVLGQITRGRLGDSLAGAMYQFTAPNTGSYTFNLRSDDFDTVLNINGPDGLDLRNDDADGQGSDSEITTILSEGDLVTLTVESWGSSQGDYTLSVSVPRTIAVGDVYNEPLDGTATFQLSGNAGDYLNILLLSEAENVSLTAVNEYGNSMYGNMAETADEEFDYSTSINYFFERDETLTLQISAWSERSGMDYELRIVESDLGEIGGYEEGYEIQPGEEVVAMISSSNYSYDSNPGHLYTIRAQEGEHLRITMESDSLDPYVTLIAPDGQEFYNDDGYVGYNSLLDLEAPVSGVYQLYASAYGGRSGVYELNFSVMGETVVLFDENGELTSSDERDVVRGSRFDLHSVVLEEGQQVSISVSSSDFDTRLAVNGPDGNMVAENDDFNGTDSRVEITADESGEYSIIVFPYSESGLGEYSLRVVEW